MFLFSNVIFGQRRKIVLLNNNNNKPIELAKFVYNGTISFSDKDGIVFIKALNNPNDSIYISAFGYFSKKMIVNKLKDTIFLESNNNIKLNEVSIKLNKNKKSIIGSFKINHKNSFWQLSVNEKIITKFTPYNVIINKKISQIEFKLKKIKFYVAHFNKEKKKVKSKKISKHYKGIINFKIIDLTESKNKNKIVFYKNVFINTAKNQLIKIDLSKNKYTIKGKFAFIIEFIGLLNKKNELQKKQTKINILLNKSLSQYFKQQTNLVLNENKKTINLNNFFKKNKKENVNIAYRLTLK